MMTTPKPLAYSNAKVSPRYAGMTCLEVYDSIAQQIVAILQHGPSEFTLEELRKTLEVQSDSILHEGLRVAGQRYGVRLTPKTKVITTRDHLPKMVLVYQGVLHAPSSFPSPVPSPSGSVSPSRTPSPVASSETPQTPLPSNPSSRARRVKK